MENLEELEKEYEVSYNTIEAKQGAYYLYLQKKAAPHNPDKHFGTFKTLSLREAIKFAKEKNERIRDGISYYKDDKEDTEARLICDALNSLLS